MNEKRFLIAVWMIFTFLACSKKESSSGNRPVRDTAIIKTYPRLYKAVFKRDARQILAFTSDSSGQIRTQAWRALAQTPVDSLSSFIKKVKQSKFQVAWFALSMHKLSSGELRDLENYWLHQPAKRASISLVLGRQGDAQSLSFLLNHVDEISHSDYEQKTALAIARLMTRFKTDKKQQRKVINAAFGSGDATTSCSWLYAFYRGGKTTLAPTLRDTLHDHWKTYGIGKSARVDQYIAKILSPDVFQEIIRHYDASKPLNKQVQLGDELAKSIAKVKLTPSSRKAVRILLNHLNPHVQQQALAALAGNLQPNGTLSTFIKKHIIGDDATSPFVWLQALETVSKSDSTIILSYKKRLRKIGEEHPYLFPQVLRLWMKAETDGDFLKQIEKTIAEDSPLKSMYAVNALNDFWAHSNHKTALKTQVRSLAFRALAQHDRGVTYSAQPLLGDSLLFGRDDFSKINRYLRTFSLPGDIEVYQTFGALYKDRFEKQARPVIDSLAALHYAPLNRSLKQSGWDVTAPEKKKVKFRIPDWNRLWKLGRHPVWILQTAKGNIKVQMNTLSAPATVSAIDSLTRAGAYDGVPFHRVVPNFVIQGGDIERRDGFGGPDFVIPTEACEQGFIRGAAGIASAGPDTEGSQYFFMNQWAPHLDGGYTLFGQVIEGMDLVDKIIVGDKVEKAYWE